MNTAVAANSQEVSGFQKAIADKLRGKEFFGHPAGLFVLFFAEMWERFSYYGMRALLILYMVKYLLADPEKAKAVIGYPVLEHGLSAVFGQMTVQQMGSQIYGLYTGFVYFTPFFGGMLADRILGQHKSVYLGGILMAIGHFLMASEQCFLLALLFLIMGNGCFKPNISTQVGNLYAQGDRRRDSAFTIFYMGINLGALLSPFICGTLGQKVGWDWGFGSAGVGMLVGLVMYWIGAGLVPKDNLTRARDSGKSEELQQPLSSQDWKKVFALVVLMFLNISFFAIYEQQGNTLQLWADDRTNWVVFGFHMPSTWFQAFNSAFIIMFAPLLDKLWAWQSKRNGEPSSISKMGIGCFLTGISYIIMIVAAQIIPENEKGSMFWLVSSTWIYTMGELYLSPIGLSFVTKVAPTKIASMMMGVWLMSYFFGNYLAGYLGTFYNVMSKQMFFAMLTAFGVGAGFLFFVVKRPMSRAIGREV